MTLRGTKYRESIELHHRPAATVSDLMDGINDVRPHIVHFSGHGGDAGLLFDNGSVDAPDDHPLAFDLLAQVLAATDTPPKLLVLNACDTLDGSDLLLRAVPVVVAMSDTITDVAAALFATKFYAAIASAQSVASALKQARVAMEFELVGDADLPQHVAREDTDIGVLVLVQPPDNL